MYTTAVFAKGSAETPLQPRFARHVCTALARRWKGDIIAVNRVYNRAVCGQDAKEFILLSLFIYIYIHPI